MFYRYLPTTKVAWGRYVLTSVYRCVCLLFCRMQKHCRCGTLHSRECWLLLVRLRALFSRFFPYLVFFTYFPSPLFLSYRDFTSDIHVQLQRLRSALPSKHNGLSPYKFMLKFLLYLFAMTFRWLQ